MKDDLVKRLRDLALQSNDGHLRGPALSAADRIEADAARIAELKRDKIAMRDERDRVKIAAANYGALSEAWRKRADAAEARVKELEAVLTGLLRAWDEVCKAVPSLANQPEAVIARAALEGEKT